MLTAVSVQSIRVVNFPKYGGNGEAWDAYAPFATDPDLFVKLLWNNSAIYTSEVRDNVAYGTIAEFSQGFPFSLVPFDQPLMLELFDSDGVSSDDNVGYFNFSPLDYQDQNSIVLSAGDLKIELQVQWFYE
jgi:hypothetical protein